MRKGLVSSRKRNDPEVKRILTMANKAADTTSSIQLLNGLDQGSDVDQRIGRKIRMIRLYGNLDSSVTAGTGVDQNIRLAIVLDRQANGNALVVTDVFEDAGPFSLPNLNYESRFKILWTALFPLNASAEAGSRKHISVSIPLGQHVFFNAGVAGTVADIVTNSLYLVVSGSEAAGATASVCTTNLRVLFTDE